MIYSQKRRATAEEVRVACFVRGVAIDRVAEGWIDEDGRIQLVLVGFIDKLNVNVTCGAKEPA